MQFSLGATGSRATVEAALNAQVTSEKARLSLAKAPAELSAAVDSAAAAVLVDLSHVPTDEPVAFSVSVTIHRPDESELNERAKKAKIAQLQAELTSK